MNVSLILNGAPRTVECTPGETLLSVLRREGCFSARFGSETGETGAAAVLIDGNLVSAEVVLAAQADGHGVTTVESLDTGAELHPIQTAFVEAGALQSGYSAGAMILAAKALLDRDPDPSEAEIRDALSGILDRESGYAKVVAAVRRAAARLRGDEPPPCEPLLVPRLTASVRERGVVPRPPAAVPLLVPSAEAVPRAVVGKPERKVDATRLVRGKPVFADDVELRGLLHAKVLRSPHAHARIIAIDDHEGARVARSPGGPPLREHAAGEVRVRRADLAEPVSVGPGELRRQGPPRRRSRRGRRRRHRRAGRARPAG